MGLRELSEELASVLIEGAPQPCCGSLEEVLRTLARDAGLQEDSLVESMKCDEGCKSKFMDKDGSFDGASNTGDEFEACKKMFGECCTGVKDPEALCAYIGRKAGKI